MTKIFALREEYEIGGRVRLKPDKIEKILTWLVSQDQTALRAFFGTIQSTRYQVLSFTEPTRRFTHLIWKVKQRQSESEELAFQILQRICDIKAAMFGQDPVLPMDLYSDILNFAAGCYISQIQDDELRLLVYDSFTLLPTEWNYNTYRHGLVAIMKFTKKYSHMLTSENQSDIHTDHKPFVEFLDAEYHEDIFMRQAKKFRLLNICIQQILVKKDMVADGLSRVLFNNPDCSPDWLVSKLTKEVFAQQDDERWFQKLGKESYRDMVIQFIMEDQDIRIKKYGEDAVSAFLV